MGPSFDKTPSLASQGVRARSVANRAFVIESLVLVALLAVSVAIVLQVFMAAHTLSGQAHALSMSEHLASNAAERFASDPASAEGVAYYTNGGEVLPSGSTATFSVETRVSNQPTGTGVLYHADIDVMHYRSKGDPDATYSLSTDRYVAGSAAVEDRS